MMVNFFLKYWSDFNLFANVLKLNLSLDFKHTTANVEMDLLVHSGSQSKP